MPIRMRERRSGHLGIDAREHSLDTRNCRASQIKARPQAVVKSNLLGLRAQAVNQREAQLNNELLVARSRPKQRTKAAIALGDSLPSIDFVSPPEDGMNLFCQSKHIQYLLFDVSPQPSK